MFLFVTLYSSYLLIVQLFGSTRPNLASSFFPSLHYILPLSRSLLLLYQIKKGVLSVDLFSHHFLPQHFSGTPLEPHTLALNRTFWRPFLSLYTVCAPHKQMQNEEETKTQGQQVNTSAQWKGKRKNQYIQLKRSKRF